MNQQNNPLVDLLAQLNKFLPRIKPLRPENGRQLNPDPSLSLSDQTLPFTNIKRDLVRLLSILTFHDKGVGDQVRIYGGVQIVLGLCEVDERNPCRCLDILFPNRPVFSADSVCSLLDLRELALFTVRNLMLNNPENQAIIGQMDPLGLVGENGELLPLPEQMKKRTFPTSST